MLTPTRHDAIQRAGLRSLDQPSPFRAEADAALARFRADRDDLAAQVRSGTLTVKVARERAGEAARAVRADLTARAAGYSPAPAEFLSRLADAAAARQKARDAMPLEGLQRETNRLLRATLVESQAQSRAAEFEARAFVRPVAGGPPAPTLDGLLAFHRAATDDGDEPAREWARRQLEAFRTRVAEDADVRRIDLACDRPDRVNPRLVRSYVAAMAGRDAAERELFVDRALAEGDANACVAAFVLARDEPAAADSRWARGVLAGLAAFPDAALATLRSLEADARAAEADAARAQADLAIARAEDEARLHGLENPTAAELDRAARAGSMPMARPAVAAEWGGFGEGEGDGDGLD